MQNFFNMLAPNCTRRVHCAPLNSLRVFVASGADAVRFLHSQLTNDIAKMPSTEARFAGYCTARGRLLATTLLWREPDTDSVIGLIRAGLIDSFVKRLNIFVLRAQVSWDQPSTMLAGVSSDASQLAALSESVGETLPTVSWARVETPTGTWIAAPKTTSALRWWWIATPEQADLASLTLATLMSSQSESIWQSSDLASGLPWIDTTTLDMFIPQMVNLDLIGGVDFTKGCYPGQEIVARMHYLGKVKRRMTLGHITLASSVGLPGQDVFDAKSPHSPCGRIVDAAGENQVTVLFEIQLDALKHPHLRLGDPDGPSIEPAALPYSWA